MTRTPAEWIALARELAARFAERAPRHDREGSFPFENFEDLRTAGFLALTVPRRYGGFELPLPDYLRVLEELAAGDASTALGLAMHLVRFGAEREAPTIPERWFAELCRGAVEHGLLVNTAATEEGLGSPAGGGIPETRAAATEGGWVLNGRKTFTTLAPALRAAIVSARLALADPGPPVIGNFLVFLDEPGVRVVETWDSLGMRATGSHDLILEDVFLPHDRLLNQRAAGTPDPRGDAAFVWFALGIAAVTIGVARAARDYAVAFARERVPLGQRPIREMPGVRARIARIDLLIHRARTLVADAAHAWHLRTPDPPPAVDRAAMAKIETLNAAIEAVDLAMRVVGGVSLLRNRPLERHYRDVRAGLHNPPLEDRALEQLARRALDEAPFPTGAVE